MDIKTSFPPNWTEERLFEKTLAHVERWDGALTEYPREHTLRRWAVNFLRHQFTTYDSDQTEERRAAANDSIGQASPYLIDECARQNAARECVDSVAAEYAEIEMDDDPYPLDDGAPCRDELTAELSDERLTDLARREHERLTAEGLNVSVDTVRTALELWRQDMLYNPEDYQ
jgi:hypothetical protein